MIPSILDSYFPFHRSQGSLVYAEKRNSRTTDMIGKGTRGFKVFVNRDTESQADSMAQVCWPTKRICPMNELESLKLESIPVRIPTTITLPVWYLPSSAWVTFITPTCTFMLYFFFSNDSFVTKYVTVVFLQFQVSLWRWLLGRRKLESHDDCDKNTVTVFTHFLLSRSTKWWD